MSLRLTLLGSVQGWRDGEEVELGPAQQRAVLVMLALRAPGPVSTKDLVEGVCGREPPARAVSMMRTYVARLRKILEPDREAREKGRTLTTVMGGYRLELSADALDAAVFESFFLEAGKCATAGDPEGARAALNRALSLWRGAALTGIPGPYAEAQRTRLFEMRFAALEQVFELDLVMGRHADIVPELSALVREHPLRERLHGLLMLALYRSGRQADALTAFAYARQLLVREMAVEPGVELQDLHRLILACDPKLAPPSHARLSSVVPLGSRLATQLPSALPDFTGRQPQVRALVATLCSAAERGATVALVSGMAGVGKSALAVHVAHVIGDCFPDGQLYAGLRGVTGEPRGAEEVLASFLHALGVAAHDIPDCAQERATRFRSLLHGKRVLVVLDDAVTAAQVRELLPGGPPSAVLVTARGNVPGLAATSRMRLGTLRAQEAVQLLASIVGPGRVSAEPVDARRLAALCGHLPLAVRIAASRLAAHPTWLLATLADRLSDEHRRIAELRVGDLAIEPTFHTACLRLPDTHARALRRLAATDASELPLPAVARCLELTEERAEEIVDGLVEAALLESPATGRYRFHSLVKAFARQWPGCPVDRPGVP